MLQHDKKTRPSYSQRVGHLHVARTSTYLRTRRFPSAVVSFSFEKNCLNPHQLPRRCDGEHCFFLSLLRLLDSRAHLQSPFTEVSHWLCMRFDSLSKFVTKHTRLDRDDDARSSYNLNTRYCDSSSPSQVSGQKNPAQRPLISFCWRRREKLCTATLPWRSKIGTRWRDEDVQLRFKLNPRNHPVSRTGVSILMLVDMKAALSHALERTLMLALARPARYTQVCLRGSHAHAHLHGEFGTGLAFRQRIMCHTHVVSNEKNFRLQQKTCLSMPLLPRPLHHPTTQPPICFPPVQP